MDSLLKTFPAFVLATACVSSPAWADDSFRPGQWEVKQTVVVDGASMPPQTLTFCHEAGDPEDPMPSQKLPEGCSAGKTERSGKTLRWEVTCTGENAMQGHGEMTWQGDQYEGTMRMKTNVGVMTTHMRGRRIGDC